MDEDRARQTFVHEVRSTLTDLYDPNTLRRSPLSSLLGVEDRADAVFALRHVLAQAIEALKPDKTVPPASNAWRLYRILYYRFIDQLSQREVATDLALSARQLRR